ncbi:hypothetical protein CLG96_05910 [Sphingomonas oleivorans]|uniref:Restriction endonuclease n=2 Tax=Sphingomonas oleivorans TaxID=1735121 RepID=A0A2T5FZH0_9SPHN|nr:hypothetical protein CLG96_05910 [Sphingomonas oleivorans]
MSAVVAVTIGAELRRRGCKEARPAEPGELGGSGAERRMAGGIGAKKVDVTWATEESGLLLGISIKTINFRDSHTRNFQKNLTNRRGDMLIEAVTLHRRFPYAVLAGFFFLDAGAHSDHVRADNGAPRRRSTFINAHQRLKLFTGREDPHDRDEQFERFYLILVEASPDTSSVRAFPVGEPDKEISIQQVLNELMALVAERNPDFYEFDDTTGKLIRARS